MAVGLNSRFALWKVWASLKESCASIFGCGLSPLAAYTRPHSST
jgi:hypothetical protein